MQGTKGLSAILSTVIILAAATLCATGCQTCPAGSVTTGEGDTACQLSGRLEGNCRIIEMTARRFAFDPDTLVVNQGEDIRIQIMSVDVAHGFKMGTYNIDMPIMPGVPQIIMFTATKSGTHAFICNIYCGAGHSLMRGKMIVLPAPQAAR